MEHWVQANFADCSGNGGSSGMAHRSVTSLAEVLRQAGAALHTYLVPVQARGSGSGIGKGG